MMIKKRTQIFFTVLFFAFINLLIACSATKLVDMWIDTSLSVAPLKKVLIIGVSDNEMERRLFEQTFANNFVARGVDAHAGYLFLPAGVNPADAEVTKVIEEKDFDAVLITQYVGTDEEKIFVPGRTRVESDYGGRRRDSRYYRDSYTVVHMPGYYSKQTSLYIQTNIYEASARKMFWSARSETVNPASLTDAIDSLSEAVLKRLEQDGFIRAPNCR